MSVLYPDVPIALGVPPVLRNALTTADATLVAIKAGMSAPSPADWGVYSFEGQRLLQPDSVVAVEYTGEHRIIDYPVEGGDFQSYNRVRLPFQVRLVMAKGGTASERAEFLSTLERLRNSLTLCDVVTPEATYTGVNLTRVRLARAADQGATLLSIEVMLEEVRETVAVAYSVAKPSPSADSATSSTDATASVPATQPAKPATPWSSKPDPYLKNMNPWLKPGAQPAGAARAQNRGAILPKTLSHITPKVTTQADGTKTYVYDLRGL